MRKALLAADLEHFCLATQEVAAGVRHFKELLAAVGAEARAPRTTRSGKPYSSSSAASGKAHETKAGFGSSIGAVEHAQQEALQRNFSCAW